MQAIMLAAGMGKRLGKYTKDNTKCMLEVNGITLLDRAVSAIKKAGISKLIFVVGYRAENLKQYVKENIKDIEIVFVNNDIYDKTNNIYSLYLAKNFLLNDDTILLESDLIFEENIIKDIVESSYKDLATVALYEPWMDGTVTLIDEHDSILEFVEKKDFSFDNTDKYYKTVNIYKFSKEFSKTHYIPFLEAYIKAYGKNEYYELVLKAITHLSKSGLKAFKLENKKWYEIDDAQDLDIASNMFADKEHALSMYQKRFGGYWRFNELKDFCYLVNPYFPPKAMIEKIKYIFDNLMTQYPSGMYIQNINAGRMFNIDEEKIIVGNGAAELINSLKNVIKGKVALSIPTFNEYIRCFPQCEFKFIDTSLDEYKFNKEKILNCINEVDNLFIINPDNPSGAFITYEDIIDIIEVYNQEGKKVIIDESFIDFACPNKKYTLINNELLEKYKNLIVIKSISKSYGVPGIRLGVLCTSDLDVLKIVKRDMPVWNINSFGEYFLQIITLYEREYIKSCELIADERKWLYTKLCEIPYIKPFESEANYILCEVTNGYNATTLAEELVMEYKIYIKDLAGKDGFGGKQYIRVAVRDRVDNRALIQALCEYGVKND
ncbi:aminotransferase class I/II-fold pyridoxal phosphate-dependent enzyme [Clostridium tertium]